MDPDVILNYFIFLFHLNIFKYDLHSYWLIYGKKGSALDGHTSEHIGISNERSNSSTIPEDQEESPQLINTSYN